MSYEYEKNRRRLRFGQLNKFQRRRRNHGPRSEFIGMCHRKEHERAQRSAGRRED